jgi:hypothetical protein
LIRFELFIVVPCVDEIPANHDTPSTASGYRRHEACAS